ncbi:SET domain-containing protein 5 [Chaetomidium leptoderma]|uniref:SET domain-containing protein 5 n=1 Tax=Chaetomidium leptoderma TaxID=669021 RepID=A0AAN6VIL8_9PEZI|nr:SET domain-containing protein 5 [Chaetomidium leptoderma]
MAARRRGTLKVLGLTALLPYLAQVVLAHGSLHKYSTTIPLPLRPLALDVACPLPVDDVAEAWPLQRPSPPWTHPPECEHAMDRTTKYCAYINSRHGSHGWSIVTSPETAADSAALLSKPLNTSRLGENWRDAPYKIVDMPGKGKGVVATRAIKQHEEILLDYATVLVDIMFTTRVPAVLGYRLLHAAVDRLSDPASILDLGRSNGLAKDEIENVLRTNAFNTPVGGVPHIALYPTLSVRGCLFSCFVSVLGINHACKPNAYTRFITESLQVSVGAARDIEAGEEITNSYIPLGQPSADRKQKLQRWGFTCRCSLCAASPAETAASDTRRREIERLRDHAVRAFQGGQPYQALRLTRQVLGLLPAEGLLHTHGGEQYENMARVFFVLRDMRNAEKYANLSLGVLAEQGYIQGGVGGEHLERMWKRFEEEEGGRY